MRGRHHAIRGLCGALLCAAACLWAAGASASPSHQAVAYQQSATHTGYIANANLTTPLTKEWTVSLPGAVSHPLIANGLVFVTASNKTVYALNQATGATVWSHSLGGTLPFSGLAYDRGRVFTLDNDGQLTAFEAATGSIVWNVKVGDAFYFTSDPTAVDGIVYAAGSSLSAVRERGGRVLWSQRFGVDHSSPTVDAGAVYVADACNNARAFDRFTGEPLWFHAGTCSGGGGRTPVVANGTLFSRGVFANLMLSGSTGSELGPFSADPAPALAGGTAFMLSGSTLKAIAGSGLGATSWQFTGDGNLVTAPLAVGGLVFMGSSLGALYALNAATGATAWSTNVGAPISAPDEVNVSQPLSGLGAANGTLIVPAGNALIAYRTSGAINSAPANLSAPTVDGNAQENDVLAADVGIWSRLPNSYAYQWQRCDGAGTGCANVDGATGATITLAHGDIGSTWRVSVVATNTKGSSASITSAVSEPVIEAAPVNQTPPEIIGVPQEGETLVADPGTWSGTPTEVAFQWRRCFGTSTLTCTDIADETDHVYVVDSGDVGAVLEVRVTATNDIGDSDPVDSAPTETVLMAAPVNLQEPSVFGDFRVGGLLSLASVGSWSGHPTSYHVQWFACDATGTSCPDLPNATGPNYSLRAADLGLFVGVEIVATNAGGDSDPADSDALGPVLPQLSANLTPPTITGVAQEGQILTASPGTWSGSPTSYAYQWFACNPTGTSCADLPNATGPAYSLRAADVGLFVGVEIVATNAGGDSDPADSDTLGPVLRLLANLTPPTVSGVAQEGQILTASPGSWSGNPTGYAYQWYRCLRFSTCTAIAGANASTYEVVGADINRTLYVGVTAINAGAESDEKISAPTATVSTGPPLNRGLPTIAGVATQGQTLTATQGTWSSNASAFRYRWRRCASDGTGCSAGVGSESTYQLGAQDVGMRLVVEVTASVGILRPSAPATSAPTPVVLPLVPTSNVSPFVDGKAQSGQTLEALPGSWTNSPTQYAFQWKRCNAAGGACVNIAGANDRTYKVGAADVGLRLAVEVVASNAGGASTPAVSSVTDVVLAAPNTTFASVKTRVGRGGVIRLYERAHDPGKYSWVATFKKSAHGSVASYAKGSVQAAKPGTAMLTVRPTTRARHALAAVHKLRVRITVTFRSARGGSPRSQVRTLIVSPR